MERLAHGEVECMDGTIVDIYFDKKTTDSTIHSIYEKGEPLDKEGKYIVKNVKLER